jgi:hypothetical protein
MPRKDQDAKRAADNAGRLDKSRDRRDIAPDYPGPGDLGTRAACERDFKLFCETYFPKAFNLPWGKDHPRIIERMEEIATEGGLLALAMPRASGKTALAIRLAIWALLYGYRRYVVLTAATERLAKDLLKAIKVELTLNERLARDFRQVCYPLQKLEGHARKAGGQHFAGHPTQIEWAKDRLTFPYMPESALDGPDVGGSTISVVGLTGAIRGQFSTLRDGTILRPDLVIGDDPSTRESANSPSQNADRLALVNGDILGLAGPGRKIASIFALTVITGGDLADVLLDRRRSPQWRGEKCRMLDSLPTNEELWGEYRRLREAGRNEEANELYRSRQAEMDAGADPTWPARFNADELSAVQGAMNLKIDNEAVFMSEYQNSPIDPHEGDSPRLTAAQIAAKTNGIRRGLVPLGAEMLTAFIDVHDQILYFGVLAWSPEFTGWLVDYGTHPQKGARYFTQRKPSRPLSLAYPGTGKEGAIRAGLLDLTASLLSRDWPREDGTTMRIGKCLIDSGYQPAVVGDVVRHSPHAAVLQASRGIGITASGRPIPEYDKTRGDRIGFNWLIPRLVDQTGTRRFSFDSNFWKSFVHARLAAAIGDPGCLSLYGHHADEHRLLADHLTAETPIRTTGQGRALDEWRTRPDRQDNHWLDVVCGAAAAASYLGAILPGSGATPRRNRERVSMSAWQKFRQATGTRP